MHQLDRDAALDDIHPPSGLAGVMWAPTTDRRLALLADDRYLYSVRLDAPGSRDFVATFMSLVESLQPIPRPGAGAPSVEAVFSHWLG